MLGTWRYSRYSSFTRSLVISFLASPIDVVFPPREHLHGIQEVPGLFLTGTVAIHEDHTQDIHQSWVTPCQDAPSPYWKVSVC